MADDGGPEPAEAPPTAAGKAPLTDGADEIDGDVLQEDAPSAEAPAPHISIDTTTSASKFRSGWASTPRVPAQQTFVPELHERHGSVKELDQELDAIRSAKRYIAEAHEEEEARKRENRERREAEARAKKDAEVEEAISHSIEARLENAEAEFERVKQERLAKVRAQQLEHERLREQHKAEREMQDKTLDESLEEGAPEQAKEDLDEQAVPWHRRRKYRCALLLLLLVAAIVGIVAGLLSRDKGNNETTNESAAVGDAGGEFNWVEGGEIPLVVERTCKYELRRTMQLGVTDNGVDSRFWGSASDFDGTDAVVVSHSRSGGGAVWALSENAAGSWGQSAFQSSWPDQSGWDVAVRGAPGGGDGAIIVVGAPAYQGRDVEHWENNEISWWAGRGAAVVFAKDDKEKWYEQALLVPAVADEVAGFGVSVAISECGCYIAIGAWHDRDNRGSVYVFSKIRGMWVETQKLAPVTARSQSVSFHGNFGSSVAISDTMLAVLAPFDYADGRLRGVVYVYSRDSDGRYQEVQQLPVDQGEQLSVTSGAGLAFLDDFLLVGAGGNRKVFVFRSTSSGYQKTTELTASDAGRDSIFGVSMDGQGTQVMVQDCGEDAAYLFAFEGGVWKEKAKFNGCNTSLSGNSIVSQSNQDFALTGSLYGGPVSFYDLVCEV